MSTALRAHGLAVRRGGRTILRDVDLAVEPGEVVALVGPNGAGKSTLLGALSGDLTVDAGSVMLFDRPVGEWTALDAARRRAVLLQDQVVAFPFTVRDVVAMGRAPWPQSDTDDAIVDDCLQAMEVTGLAGRRITALSGGERARVALARVLAQTTPVLLLDEPTAALDLHHQEHVFGVIRERADAGAAVVVVVHDLALAAAHCPRIAIVGAGRLQVAGPPSEVLEPERLSQIWGHRIEVIAHPRTGRPIVLPRR